MSNEESVSNVQLEIIEPMGEACLMGVQFAFDAALALF